MELIFGQQAILSIVVHLFFIGVAWWALQALKFDLIVKTTDVLRARILFIFITIALGSAVAEFFLAYFYYSMQLKYLF
ncbi:hypothetical protein CIB95_11410 [Lottiidibacillus patelloidae]|uniref:DUF1146 domain-containing protein n=1 Tax=Lottiidibacillus patelloidae TaxID=2670334 RepID=A0A263BT76_9BACI|nr:DUF1146 family protein [Lottiidibacillus patelloidae]OZM56376.1 hypothetical protein CIB95_11410 [Lottiidibacillus patelloidae]